MSPIKSSLQKPAAPEAAARFQAPKPPGTPAARPRSVKLVAAVGWRWSAGNSRRDTCFISSDGICSRWYLWQFDRDDDLTIDDVIAHCSRAQLTETEAAGLLLETFWAKDAWNADLEAPHWISPGLLTEAEVQEIAGRVV